MLRSCALHWNAWQKKTISRTIIISPVLQFTHDASPNRTTQQLDPRTRHAARYPRVGPAYPHFSLGFGGMYCRLVYHCQPRWRLDAVAF